MLWAWICVSFSGLFVFGLLKDPAMLRFAYTLTGSNPDGTAHLCPLAFWVVVLWSSEEKLLVSSFNSQLVKSSSTRVSVFFFNKLCLCVAQKLEEAAANATEEETRRLQTQKELQDLYRVEMEKEKLVLVFSVYLIGDCLASFLLTWHSLFYGFDVMHLEMLIWPIAVNDYFSSTGDYYRKYTAAYVLLSTILTGNVEAQICTESHIIKKEKKTSLIFSALILLI